MMNILNLTPSELETLVTELGDKKFRAGQVFGWLAKGVSSFDQMINVPKSLRESLEAEGWYIGLPEAVRTQKSADGTVKCLFSFADGAEIESVFMKYSYGNSICISSQAGCRMGCSFCASTLRGLTRQLAPSEMLEQIYAISRETGERVSHVVVMGMGEPLDNYDSLVRFLRLLTCPEGMNLSQRNVTVSTCGIVPNIYRLAEEGLHITLALSLHAATDEQRQKIMPVAKRWPIAELMDACRAYYQKTGRQVTFEYSLIRGVNDSRADARGLARLALPLQAHINLIPVNPVQERGFVHPDSGHIAAFKKELENHGVNVSIRRALGKDIEGACGQLRNRFESDVNPI